MKWTDILGSESVWVCRRYRFHVELLLGAEGATEPLA